MAYGKLSRHKNRDEASGVYPLSNRSVLRLFMAYQKKVHSYSKRVYHLNFYELIVLYIVDAINAEAGRPGASLDDVSHYMGWNVMKRGHFYLNRLLSEGWLVNANSQPSRTGVNYILFLSLKCEMALKDIERHCNVLLSALPPREGEKQVKVKRVVDIEKKRAKELAKWEGLGLA